MFEFAIDNLLASGAESLQLSKNILNADLSAIGALDAFGDVNSLYGATAFNGFLDLGALPPLATQLEPTTALPEIPVYQNLATTVSTGSLAAHEGTFDDFDNLLDLSNASTNPNSPSSLATPSSPGSPANYLSGVFPGYFQSNNCNSNNSSGGEEQVKKKRRRPKPRMADLPPSEAQAKRESNRESARKCRERKKEREAMSSVENVFVKQELNDLRQQVQLLTTLLIERDATIAALTGQPMPKRLRLETMSMALQAQAQAQATH